MTRDYLVRQDSALACGNSPQPSAACAELQARIARLTAAQLDVLELVALRRTSKEIARALGISPVTVDQRVKRAQAVLGVSSRSDAARMLISARDRSDLPSGVYGKAIYGSSGLSNLAPTGDQDLSIGEWNPATDSDHSTLRQSQATYFAGLHEARNSGPFFSVLEEIRRPEGLTVTSKALIILAIMIITLVAFAILVSFAEGVSRII